MAWTSIVTLDPDSNDIGTVAGTFTDTDATTFTFTQRVAANSAALSAYVNAAIAARDAWQTKKSTEATYVTDVNNAFVATDPQ